MNKTDSRHIIQEMLDLADVRINGDRPWDIQVHNQKFYEGSCQGVLLPWEKVIWMAGGTVLSRWDSFSDPYYNHLHRME